MVTDIFPKCVWIVWGLYIAFIDCHSSLGRALAAAELPGPDFPFPLWLEGSGGWKKKKKKKQRISFCWLERTCDWCVFCSECAFDLEEHGWLRNQDAASWKDLLNIICCLFWGVGSLIPFAVDLNRRAGGSDYITHKRTGLSDFWGSPKSRKESWLFGWSHHWWKGLSFVLSFFFL